ncbi:helix-turn-helix transcriptional regulator [Methylobacterium sp. GC_Met_1]|uniref:helix-turn-helix transcriptional regulator n=1 Tax=Methylobacterium sp. GC_Met_1 TaxID=2937377 RepID=UPI002269E9D5|nr:helix-turn-helix transcriptional regulator [Methylobacterium sp. GC_Met_1]
MMSFYADIEGPRVIAIADRFPQGTDRSWAGGSDTVHEPGNGAAFRSRGVAKAEHACAGPTLVDMALGILVNNFEQGVAVTDPSARVHFLNRAGHALVRAGLLRLEGGHLRGPSPSAGVTLRSVIAGCAADGGRSARLVSEHGVLLVAACAIPAPVGSIATSTVLLRFTDPASVRPPDTSVLQSQFGLTPAEAALAADVLAGHDLAASAVRRGIKPNTAKVHLRHIFEKTGARRQAELMRLLLLCPQPIAVRPDLSPE